MRVVCRCEHCQQTLRAAQEMLGKLIRCPGCGSATRLRAAPVGTAEPTEGRGPPVSAPRPEAAPADLDLVEEVTDEAPSREMTERPRPPGGEPIRPAKK